LTTLGRRSKCN